LPAPAGFSPERWEQARAAALAFAEESLPRALALGWSLPELFGLHPIAPATRLDCRGLAFTIRLGARVVAMTADTARIRTSSGALLTYYRRPVAGAVPA
jgi:hypothetical protein